MKIKKTIAVSDSGFIFDSGTGDSYTLNSTGQEIFKLLQSGFSEKEILDRMTTQYDVDPNVFEQYFVDFIGMLKHFQISDSDE